MAKKKCKVKHNKMLTSSANQYSLGGDIKDAFSKESLEGAGKQFLGGAGNALGSLGSSLISGDLNIGAGSAISNVGGTIGSALSSVNPILGGAVSAASGIIGGLTNRMFGSKLNNENIAEVEGINNSLNTLRLDSSNNNSVLGSWNTQNFGKDFNKSYIGKDGWFSNKAENKYKKLKREWNQAQDKALLTYSDAFDNADTNNDMQLAVNYSAYGGPLYMAPSFRGMEEHYLQGREAQKALESMYPSSHSPLYTLYAKHPDRWNQIVNMNAFGGPINKYDNGGNTKEGVGYIGGTTDEARNKWITEDRALMQAVADLSAQYGVSPHLVIDRMKHEGIIDSSIGVHNYILKATNKKKRPLQGVISSSYVGSPFAEWGLDYIFDTYKKGITKTKRPIPFKKSEKINEAGVKVPSGTTFSNLDTLELFVAELAARQNKVKEMYPNLTEDELNAATAARYNASTSYFNDLMKSGNYKTKYKVTPVFNFPAPRKYENKKPNYFYTRERISDEDVKDYSHTHPNVYTVGNHSYNIDYIDPSTFKGKTILNAAKANYYNQTNSEPLIENYEYYNPYIDPENTFKFGGPLQTNGADWTNGLVEINNGGTHEENPNEGVPVGVDQNGTPNLVEEGEVIWNDYVFSNRLKVPEEMKKQYKYRGNTFADVVKKLQKEGEERPNDPISKKGLEANLNRLMTVQEGIRQEEQRLKEQVALQKQQYAKGGRLGNLYEGPGELPNFLSYNPYAPINNMEGLNPVEEKKPTIKDIREGVYNGGFESNAVPLLDLAAHYGTTDKDKIYEAMIWDQRNNPELNKLANKNNLKPTWMRYAPILGNSIGLLTTALSKPDYKHADAIYNAAKEAGTFTPIKSSPIGNYLQYKAFDRNFYSNKLAAQANATRDAIVNQANGNPASRMAGLLAADYNAQTQLGDMYRKGEEYNLAQRQKVEDFNRATNMYNSEAQMKADMFNQEALLKARGYNLQGTAQAMAMRQAIDDARTASINANLTNLFQGFGDIGRENFASNMITSNPAYYYNVGRDGEVSYNNDFDKLSPEQQRYIRLQAEKEAARSKDKNKKSYGGYLTIKKRR